MRWYARFRLSYGDVADGLAGRGFSVDRSAVFRWVQRFRPLFGAAARRHRLPAGKKWRVDETYCAFQGRHAYVCRAIDQDGQVVDAYCSERRNAAAAQAFFERAMAETAVTPERVRVTGHAPQRDGPPRADTGGGAGRGGARRPAHPAGGLSLAPPAAARPGAGTDHLRSA